MKTMRTCVSAQGKFTYGIHHPAFRVKHLRGDERICNLGAFADGEPCTNHVNFPAGDVDVPCADTVYEIPNAFGFRGVTYINKRWADENAADPVGRIRLPKAPEVSFSGVLSEWAGGGAVDPEQKSRMLRALPEPLQLALAETGTDAGDLSCLAEMACEFTFNPETRRPDGLVFQKDGTGTVRAVIHNRTLFEVLANNPYLPDAYKEVMVLRPGVQGPNEIMGQWQSPDGSSRVYEYLRCNSYIPWGHYAANMAEDSIRYRMSELGCQDMRGMRHLYYQRTYVRMAADLGLEVKIQQRALSEDELEDLRCRLLERLADARLREKLGFNRTLWGWNYGFDYAPTRYRLHASHQQVHQQYAMIPKSVSQTPGFDNPMPSYAVGDMVEAFAWQYAEQTGAAFFDAYIAAIENNRRMQGAPEGEHSLVIHSDENVLVFVPKAQTSQWEVNVMARQPVGNIVEADIHMRRSLDIALLTAARALSNMGARMITSYEISKPMDSADTHQRLIYTLLPRLPESPGGFSESQLRWINGHYPEDFAAACRAACPASIS
ncbi:MAG: hypothetical protein ACLFUY_08940 [Desulfobacterales bacterium]